MRIHRSAMFRPFLSLLLFAPALFLVPRLAAQQPSLNSSSCPCTLRGTVIDSVTGNPVRGAFVQASTGSAWSAFTDAEGKFQFDALPAGPITVHAAKPGYLSEDDFGSRAPKNFSRQLGRDATPMPKANSSLTRCPPVPSLFTPRSPVTFPRMTSVPALPRIFLANSDGTPPRPFSSSLPKASFLDKSLMK